jgi:hypothetical protein
MRLSLKNYTSQKVTAAFMLLICLFFISGSLFEDLEALQMTITPTSVTLYWTAPGDDDSTGIAYGYDIRYSTTPITDQNWSSATQATGEPTPGPAGNDEEFNVTNLIPNTAYYFAIKTEDESGNWSDLSNVESARTLELGLDIDVPESYQLSQNYPNPFNAATRIEYYVPLASHVTLSIYDILGRTVGTIVDGQKSIGDHDVIWSGLDDGGRPVASGLYFYRLRAGDHNYSRKMMLLK